MASGTYVKPCLPRTEPVRQIVKPRGKPWVLWMVGIVCLVAISVGALSQRPISSSYLTGGSQTYSIQVGGSLARTWQHDPATTTPTATATPPPGAATYCHKYPNSWREETDPEPEFANPPA